MFPMSLPGVISGGSSGGVVDDYNGMVFACDMTGDDGASVFIDATGRQTPTAGNLTTTRGAGLFYPSCGYGYSAGCYLKTNNTDTPKNDLIFPDEFYLEFSYKQIISNTQHAYPACFLLANGETLDGVHTARGYIRLAGNGDNRICFHTGATGPNTTLLAGGMIRHDVWTTIRLFRLAGVLYLYQDNTLVGSIPYTDVIGVGQMWFGTSSVGGYSAKGLIQKIRVWRGVNAPPVGWFLAQQMLFNGTNGQTSFTDVTNRHSPVRVGTCTNSTSQKYEGTASLLVPTGANRLTCDSSGYNSDYVLPGDFDLTIVSRPGSGFTSHVVAAFMPPDGAGLNGDPERLMITLGVYGYVTVTNGDGSLSLSTGTVFASSWIRIRLFRQAGVLYLICDEYMSYIVSQPYTGTIGVGYLSLGGDPSYGNNQAAINHDNFSLRKAA